MLKSFLLLFAGTLFALAPTTVQGRQEPAPAQTAPQAPAQAPAQPATPAPALAPTQEAAPAAAVSFPRNPVRPTAESQAKAKSVYRIDCALCHGENGDGKTDVAKSMELTLDDWTNPHTLAGREDGELFNIIRTGKNKMPPEAEGRANNDLVWNLVIYLRSFSRPETLVPEAQCFESTGTSLTF